MAGGSLKRPNLRDVAAVAGVSTATVSRTLSGNASVNPEMAKRVRAAAEQIGYRPEPNGRRRLKHNRWAVIVPRLDRQTIQLIMKVTAHAKEVGGGVTAIFESRGDIDSERHICHAIMEDRVARVVAVPADQNRSDFSQLRRCGVKVRTLGEAPAQPAS
ncbi:MAG: LacI family DNA-binding transcriptional regulator [Bifidobacteriaceae bacterium]|jgi:LacI family transcriptional regulator|nr:LacI family DNA-binding transcriptional regulator [Bifidobacteriaceae bacterium]